MCWNAIFSGINGYVVKTELIINKDSTFKFSTCSSVTKGNWALSKDSLILHVKECQWNKDSLNKVGYNGSWPNLPSKLIGFRIHDNYLESTIFSSKRHKTILLLKSTTIFNVPTNQTLPYETIPHYLSHVGNHKPLLRTTKL